MFLAGCVAVQAQVCPTDHGDATKASTLHGKIVYHDELRQWIGLNLDHPACNQSDIQLVFIKEDGFLHWKEDGFLHWREAKTLSGCKATVEGVIGESLTGYYSADLNIADPKIKVDPGCKPKPLEPDLWEGKVPKSITIYKAKPTPVLARSEVGWEQAPSPVQAERTSALIWSYRARH